MKRIGLIGGITWPATAEYYRNINLDVRGRLGGDHSAEMIIRSLDLHPLLASVADVPAIERTMLAAGRALQAADAELIAVASFTGHRYVASLRELPLPFIDLVDAVAARVAEQGLRHIAVWATSFALADDSLMSRLARASGAQLHLPPAALRGELDRIVFKELAAQQLAQSSLRTLQTLLDEQTCAGAQALLLATTDFSALAAQLEARIPVLDATRIHCEALVSAALRQ